MKPSIKPTLNEAPVGATDMIISKTDLKGRITYANRTFMRIADYSESELIGVQHNILRHPDMPRGVYRLMWNTLQSGREFFGFVKNMTKNGDFYWVFANVTVDLDSKGQPLGYFSVRRQAPKAAVQIAIDLYDQMRRIEQSTDTATAPDASLAWLEQTCLDQGQPYQRLILDLYQQHSGA